MNESNRRHQRAPAQVAVSYRTSGAFLVAYTVNLSKGGIFIEAEPLPVGTQVHLELDVPGAGRLDAEGQVAWVREANAQGLPIGMGIQFAAGLDVQHGNAIDRLVSTFEGLEILIMAAPDRRALLSRFVTSILTCDTVEAETSEVATRMIDEGVDLVIVDLDTAAADGMEVVKRAHAASPPAPIIAVAADGEALQWARDHRVDQVVKSPPTFADLQQAVIATLSRATPRPEDFGRDDTPTAIVPKV